MKSNLLILGGFFLLLVGCGRDETKTYQGYVEVRNLYLASPYSGLLMKQHVFRGQYVKKGDILFNLDDRAESLQVEEGNELAKQGENALVDLKKPKRKPEIVMVEAQLREATARLKLAELRLNRFDELYKKQATDRDHVDDALYNAEVLKGSLDEVTANLKLASMGARKDQILAQQSKVSALYSRVKYIVWQLEQKSIYAPIDAIVFDTYYVEGEFVGAEKPIAALVDPKNVRVEFFVPAKDLESLKLNQKIQFTCEGCSSSNEAVINYISPEAEYISPLIYSRENSDKIVFRIKANIVNAPLFKPGQPVIVSIAHV